MKPWKQLAARGQSEQTSYWHIKGLLIKHPLSRLFSTLKQKQGVG